MEAFDFSQVIAQIDSQMQRIGWTTDREQKHLIKTYGKRSRTSLTEEELLHFYRYLLSSISISYEILRSRINAETKRLGWTQEQRREHLIKSYEKRTLSLLIEPELLDFLQYLTSESTVTLDKALIARTDVELQRLGWTPEQGWESLIKTNGKGEFVLLTSEQLQEFLKYLQSQPDPLG